MMFDVQISEQADRGLRDIFGYIAFELLAPENAAGQLDRLEDAISKLDNMPEKFRRYEREENILTPESIYEMFYNSAEVEAEIPYSYGMGWTLHVVIPIFLLMLTRVCFGTPLWVVKAFVPDLFTVIISSACLLFAVGVIKVIIFIRVRDSLHDESMTRYE